MPLAKTEQAAQIKAEPNAQDAVVASLLEVANTDNTKAKAALIFSLGAMLASVASRAHCLSSSAGMDDVLVIDRVISRLCRSRASPHGGPRENRRRLGNDWLIISFVWRYRTTDCGA